jgi:hypothetical protein
MGIAAPVGGGPIDLTNGTLQGVTDVLTDKVWRPVQSGGLSAAAGSNQGTLNLNSGGSIASVISSTTVDPSGTNGVPKALLALAATESPSKQTGGVMLSEVSIAFTRDGSDANFGSVRIWFDGYQGNPNDTLMVSGAESPITFLCQSTKEVVVVKAQTVSPSGVSADLSFAATTTVALDGVVSAPPSPTVTQNLLATPTGYQFAFAYEAGLLADVISGYNIYRNSSNTTSGATVVKNVLQAATDSGSYVYQETVPAGTNYYYWVSVVNTSGLESGLTNAQSGLVPNVSPLNADGSSNNTSYGKNLLTNPGFELKGTPNAYNTPVAAGLVCNGWSINQLDAGFFQPMVVNTGGAAHSGSNCLYIRVPTGMSLPSDNTYRTCRIYSPAITVYGGTTLQLNGYLAWGFTHAMAAGVTALQRLNLVFFQANGTQISELGPADITNGGGSYAQVGPYTVAVPSNASYVQVECCGFIKNNSGSTFSTGSDLYADMAFDDIELVLVANLDNDLADGTTYGRVVQTALTNNAVNPSKAGVVSAGSTPYSYTGGFSFTTATTSITITWTGLSILRSDGATKSVTNGSQAITGLSSATTYYFYLYWDENLGALHFVAGGSGSPAYAQAAPSSSLVSIQNQQGKIPFTVGGMAVATTASGTGGGSGGGGGGGGCFTGNVAIKTSSGFVRFDELPLCQVFAIENLTGTHQAKLIVHENYTDNFVFIGKDKLATVGHGMKRGNEWISASKYFGGLHTRRAGITVYNLHVFTDKEEDKHYILETGDVAHNAAKVV